MLNRYENTNRASRTGDACDETSPLERKNHLMNGGRRHPEEPLHVGLSWRQTVHKGVGANERKVLTLQLRESLAVIAHAQAAQRSRPPARDRDGEKGHDASRASGCAARLCRDTDSEPRTDTPLNGA